MELAGERAARGDGNRGLLVAAAMRLDELETGTHSAAGILQALMERWEDLARGAASVTIVIDQHWKVVRAHLKMADGRKLAAQLLEDGSGSFDLNELKLPRAVTWEAADLARCEALLDGDGRIRALDRNEKGGPFFDEFQHRLRTEGLPRTQVLSGD
jgi:hypothetical protein